MKKVFWSNILLYTVASVMLFASISTVFANVKKHLSLRPWSSQYTQPPLSAGRYPWSVRSVDTQIISKHWPDVSRDSVVEQVALLKNLGVNYIAVGTPYDRTDDLYLWANEIHAAGLRVWFRSHWARWEGDDGYPATMSPEEYLDKTRKFILKNPSLFAQGDAFTVSVEAEQVGVGLGERFLTWDGYRDFLSAEISVASDAFAEIGLGGKIHTNWLSLNGWVVENQLNKELVDKMGLIVVDHFVGQSQTIGELEDIDLMVEKTVSDLDDFYEKWDVPILLGEWGYNIYQEVPDERQAEAIKKLFGRLQTKKYLVGINYWVHMGNSAAIIEDEFGTNLRYRKSAEVIKSFYDPLSTPLDIER